MAFMHEARGLAQKKNPSSDDPLNTPKAFCNWSSKWVNDEQTHAQNGISRWNIHDSRKYSMDMAEWHK